ncbi:MAG: hypothetical protein ABIM50_14600 [Novosphingobium sp.]
MKSNQSVEAMLQSIAKTERHIRSEYGTRMVEVMDTIGAHPHFAMPQQPGVVTVISGRHDVDEMYKASIQLAAPQGSRLLSQLATDWYVFVDNVPTRLWIEGDKLVTVQTVTLFVTDDEHGLTGEYAWQRLYAPQTSIADGSVPLPERELHNLELHQSLLDALCKGDTAALVPLLDPGCIWAQRNYLSDAEGGALTKLRGADAVASHVAQWHAALNPEHVSILNRRVTDWYVFSEELWVVRPAGRERQQYRMATVYPVNENGLFEGALGFGREIEALSPSADTRMGISFYPEGVAADPDCLAGYPGE